MLLRRMLFMLAIVIAIIAVLAGYKFLSIKQQIETFSAEPPPISIEAQSAQLQDWQTRLPAIGTLKAIQGIDLAVEVSGTVKSVLFNSGEQVTHGQPIVQLDSDIEQANLKTAEAQLALARVEYERGRSLVDRQAVSKSEFDRLTSELQKANASVAEIKATLAKKRILAPFSGTIGIRQVDVGGYVSAGTHIATLQDLSSLYVDFYLPEQEVPRLALDQPILLSVAARPGEQFEGRISALNPKVEDSTRNIAIRATLPNPDGKLLPGMFANLEVLLPQQQSRVLVPETAITYTLYGNSLYVIKTSLDEQGQARQEADGSPRLEVERRYVKTGERRDGQVVILEGLEQGAQVVTSGQLKLDNGSHVAIRAQAD